MLNVRQKKKFPYNFKETEIDCSRYELIGNNS